MAVAISNLTAYWATSASSVNTAIKMNANDVVSAANSKLLDLQVNDVSKFVVFKSGNTVANGIIVANSFVTSGGINLISAIQTINVGSGDIGPAFFQANQAFSQANQAFAAANSSSPQSIGDAFGQANLAFAKANAANVLAFNTGAGANAWTNTVYGFINTYTQTVGTAGNAYAREVGTAGNVYARTVGTAGNVYAREVGTAGNTYTQTVGAASNSYADSLFASSGGSAGQAFNKANTANITADQAFNRANAANVLAFNSAAGANAWTNTVYGFINTYTQTVGTAGNTYAQSVGAASNLLVGAAFFQANQAFAVANTSGAEAEGAFFQANQAFNTANTAAANALGAFTRSNVAWFHANAAFFQANQAFAEANTAETSASAAFNKANSANVLAFNSAAGANAWTNAVYGFTNTYIQTVGAASNLLVGAAYSQANQAFNTANTAAANALGAFSRSNITFTHANAAFSQANQAFAVANTAGAEAEGAFFQANQAFALANAANVLAFNALPKTGGTITGNVSIVGNLFISGNSQFQNVTTLSIGDPLIYLAANNYSSDIVDIGFIANYVNSTGSNVHTGLYREHENKMYYLFQGYDKEPVDNHIGALSNNMTLAVLNADLITSNLVLGGINAISWISGAFTRANTANITADQAFNRANAANVLAFNSAAGANAWVNTVYGFTNTYIQTVGTASNVWSNTIGVYANAYANVIGTRSNNYALSIVGPAFNQANSANVLAFNSAAGANAWVNTVYGFTNTYTQTVGAASNSLAVAAFSQANQAFAQANTSSPQTVADAFGQANQAFAQANAANVLAFNSAAGANAWANTIGVNANAYANVIGTRSNNYALSIVGPAFNKANDANVLAFNSAAGANAWTNTVYGLSNTFTHTIGGAAFGQANLAFARANGSFNQANQAFALANAANVLAFNALPKTGGTVTGDLILTGTTILINNSAGAGGTDEGGEIKLANPTSNSILSGPIAIDIYQNRIRFFETNSPNRGAFINLASTSAGAATDLLASPSATDTVARNSAGAAFDKANAANVLAFNALPNTNGVVFNGTLTASANLSADKIISTNNGNGENFRLGDDAWIGDTNIANAFRIKGQQNASIGYVIFGPNDGKLLGRDGTGPLTYDGNNVWHAGNDGTSSGLDADLLDGQQGSYYAIATDSANAFNKANGANVLAFNSAAGANAWANTIGIYANAYANVIGTRSNNFALSLGTQFDSINTYVLNTGTAVNAYANVIGTRSNNYALSIVGPAFDKANSTTYTSNVVISVTDNTNAALRITQTGTGDAVRVEDSANPDSTPFVITATGDVGIGVTSPDTKLAVVGSGQGLNFNTADNLGASILVGDSGTAAQNGGSIVFSAFSEAWKFAAIKSHVLNGTSNTVGDISILTRRVTTDSTLTETARFTFTGNVGIGTNNPQYKLDVSGAVNASAFLINGIPALPNTSGISFNGNLNFPNGNVSIGSTTSEGLLTLRGYTGGTVGSVVDNFTKTLVIGGAYNQPYNSGNTVLLHILDYDNDTGSDVYPVYIEDENNIVDFFINAGNNGTISTKKVYVGGNLGIGITSPTSKLHVSGTANITSSLEVLGSNITSAIAAGNTFTHTIGGAAFFQANQAFADANTAETWAAGAFLRGNVAWLHANAAFFQANQAFADANTAETWAAGAFLRGNVAWLHANAAFFQANQAFADANTAETWAAGAFLRGNVAFSQANQAFAVANAALPSSSYTAADVLSKLLTVDGTGSLLDADQLDGWHQSELGGKQLAAASVGTGTTADYSWVTAGSINWSGPAPVHLSVMLRGLSHGAATSQPLRIQFSDDKGVTFTTAINISPPVAASTALNGHILVYRPSATTSTKVIVWNTSPQDRSSSNVGTWELPGAGGTAALSNVRFGFASGNFDAGTVYVYAYS
jgi:hypothetical protein